MFNIGDTVKKKNGGTFYIGKVGVVYKYYNMRGDKLILCIPGKQHIKNLKRRDGDLSGFIYDSEIELISKADVKPRPKQINYQEGII